MAKKDKENGGAGSGSMENAMKVAAQEAGARDIKEIQEELQSWSFEVPKEVIHNVDNLEKVEEYEKKITEYIKEELKKKEKSIEEINEIEVWKLAREWFLEKGLREDPVAEQLELLIGEERHDQRKEKVEQILKNYIEKNLTKENERRRESQKIYPSPDKRNQLVEEIFSSQIKTSKVLKDLLKKDGEKILLSNEDKNVIAGAVRSYLRERKIPEKNFSNKKEKPASKEKKVLKEEVEKAVLESKETKQKDSEELKRLLKSLETKKREALENIKNIPLDKVGKTSETDIFINFMIDYSRLSDNQEEFIKKFDSAKEELKEALKKRKEEFSEQEEEKKEEPFSGEKPEGKDAEPEKPDSEKAEEKAETDEEIERLKQELESARKRYAKADYMSSSTLIKIKNKLPGLKTKPEEILEVGKAFEEYKENFNRFLEKQLGKIRNIGKSEEEVGEEMNAFLVMERAELSEAGTRAKWEALKIDFVKGGLEFFNKKVLGGYENWKNFWRKKGKVKGLAGMTVASFVGGVATGGVSGMVLKVLSGALAAKTYYNKQKSEYNLGLEEKTREDMKEKLESSEGLENALKAYVNETKGRFKTDKKAERVMKRDAALAGVATTGFNILLGEVVKETGLGEWTGKQWQDFWEWLKGDASISGENVEAVAGLESESKISESSGARAQTIPPTEAGLEPKVEVSSVSIEKGSSFEGAIINKLVEDGMDKAEAGKVAHRMALEFAEENNLEKGAYSLVHPGDEIDLEKNPDGSYKVSQFRAESGINPGWLEEGQTSIGEGASQASAETMEAGAQMAETQNWINSYENEFNEMANLSERISELERSTNLIETQAELEEKLAKIDETIEKASTDEWNLDKDGTELDRLTAQKMRIESTLDRLREIDTLKEKYNLTRINLLSNISRYLFSDAQEVSSFKDLSNINAKDYLAENPNSKMSKFFKGLQGILRNSDVNPESIKPKANESISVWLAKTILPQISKSRL